MPTSGTGRLPGRTQTVSLARVRYAGGIFLVLVPAIPMWIQTVGDLVLLTRIPLPGDRSR
jgi:hypothetical protein